MVVAATIVSFQLDKPVLLGPMPENSWPREEVRPLNASPIPPASAAM
ncbi:hypothetical protein [Rickettsia tamurae]|nr:hypothetical protein [Rickettsia tamurae]